MACTTQSVTITSTRKLSTAVEQKHQPAMSPYHLSSLRVLSRFLGSNNMIPSTSGDVPPCSSRMQPSTPTLDPIHDPKYLSFRNRIMSRSTEQLSILQWPAQRHLVIQSAHALPRSVSVAELHLEERPRRFERDDCGLRRVPPSISDLRLQARKQNNAIFVPERSQTFPLDPAPSKTQVNHVWNAKDGHADEQKKQRRREPCTSYQDMHIFSMYQETAALLSLQSKQTSREGSIQTTSTEYHTSDSESSRDSSPRPKTPSDRSLYENTVNFKDVMLEDERVRRVNARRVQVVEHSQRQESCHAEAEDEIMQATMLVGPGRPKLVQIHRPTSASAWSKDFFSPSQRSGISRPSTPIRDRPEISLFSPYDTPATGTPFSDISTVTSLTTPTPQHQPKLSVQTNLSIFQTQPVTSKHIISPRSDGTVFSTDERRKRSLADPFGSPLSQRSSYISCGSSYIDESPPDLTRLSTLDSKSMSEQSVIGQIALHETYHHAIFKAISSTTKALDALAINKFNLTCPEFSSFRNRNLESGIDSVLLSNLNKIFPQASGSSLSTVAAWLIVDQHFKRLFASAPPKFHNSGASSSYGLLPYEYNKPLLPPRQTPTIPQIPWVCLADIRAPLSSPQNHRSISTPLYASNIPSKAKSILGIHSNPTHCKPQPSTQDLPAGNTAGNNSAQLEEKAQYVHDSVQLIGRKLVKDAMAVGSSPRTPSHDGSSKSSRGVKHIRGRSSAVGAASPSEEPDEVVIKALWEACRCIASMA